MAPLRSREALLAFLDQLGKTGRVRLTTAQSRKASASKVLNVLNQSEAEDVSSIDVDEVMSRFVEIHGQEYGADSLASYKSRLRTALEQFRGHLANPVNSRSSNDIRDTLHQENRTGFADGSTPEGRRPIRIINEVLPIAIRADLTVYIQGLPFDLSEAEARKIGAVVTALAAS